MLRARLFSTAEDIVRLMEDSTRQLSYDEEQALQYELVIGAQFIFPSDTSMPSLLQRLRAGIEGADSTRLKKQWLRQASILAAEEQRDIHAEEWIEFIEDLSEEHEPVHPTRPKSTSAKLKKVFMGNLGLIIGLTLFVADQFSPPNPAHPFDSYNLRWADMAEMGRSDPPMFHLIFSELPREDLMTMDAGLNRMLGALRRAKWEAEQPDPVKRLTK